MQYASSFYEKIVFQFRPADDGLIACLPIRGVGGLSHIVSVGSYLRGAGGTFIFVKKFPRGAVV